MDFADDHIGRIGANTGEIKLFGTPTFDSRQRRGEVDSQHRVRYAGFSASVTGMFVPLTEKCQEWVPPTPRTKPCVTHLDRYGGLRTGAMYTDRDIRLISESGEVLGYLMAKLGVSIRRVFVDDAMMSVT